tara:strand:+ start:2262 stop:2567 length:306 start_codon:yes stop_codon:yes gene_type:complete
MAEFVLSYPFRMDQKNSRASVVYSGTSTYKAQQINALVKTEKDERPLMPDFGLTDPVFNKFEVAEFMNTLNRFYDNTSVQVTGLQVKQVGGKDTDVIIEFE